MAHWFTQFVFGRRGQLFLSYSSMTPLNSWIITTTLLQNCALAFGPFGTESGQRPRRPGRFRSSHPTYSLPQSTARSLPMQILTHGVTGPGLMLISFEQLSLPLTLRVRKTGKTGSPRHREKIVHGISPCFFSSIGVRSTGVALSPRYIKWHPRLGSSRRRIIAL